MTSLKTWRYQIRLSNLLICSLLAVLLLYPQQAKAQVLNARLITSLYTWEKFDTVNVSNKYLRGFQSIMFDIAQWDFSLRMHFQAASTLQETLDEVPDYRFYYLYGQWRNIGKTIDLSLGRLPYFAGVGNGTIDGILSTARLANGTVRLTVYGGQTSPLELGLKGWKPLKNNFTVGTQFLTTAIRDARISLSYLNRQRDRDSYLATRRDSLFSPVSVLIEPGQAKEQYLSADASYRLSSGSVYGRYDYDLNFKRIQRGQLSLRYTPSAELSITGDYIRRMPRMVFNSYFAQFDASSVDEYEAGIDYLFLPSIRGFARGAYVKYVDEKSLRYTLGISHDYLSAVYHGSTGYSGELNSAVVRASYPLLENKLIPTVSLSYFRFRLNSSDNSQDALAATLGTTLRLNSIFLIDVQGQWLRNSVMKNDFRLFARFDVWFSESLKLFD